MLPRLRAKVVIAIATASACACGSQYSATGLGSDADAGHDAGEALGASDSSTQLDAGSNIDAASPADSSAADGATKTCYASDAFGAPTLIAALNSPTLDSTPRVTSNELQVVFFTNRANGGSDWDIFAAARASLTSIWSTPTLVAGVSNSTNLDIDPVITDDGLQIFFSSNRGDAGLDNLYHSTRASALSAFGAPIAVSQLNQPDVDTVSALVSPSGKTLYFATEPTAGSADLYVAALTPAGAVSAPVAVSSINTTAASEKNPALTGDELTLFFTSDRTGSTGDEDIWVATRASTTDGWGAARNVTELNGTGPDLVGSVSRDGCRIYISKAKDTGLAGLNELDMYLAQKTPR